MSKLLSAVRAHLTHPAIRGLIHHFDLAEVDCVDDASFAQAIERSGLQGATVFMDIGKLRQEALEEFERRRIVRK